MTGERCPRGGEHRWILMGLTEMCARCGEGWSLLDHYDGLMPYHIEKKGSRFCVVKDGSGESVGCHDTDEEAKRQLGALYANEPEAEAEQLVGDLMSLDL